MKSNRTVAALVVSTVLIVGSAAVAVAGAAVDPDPPSNVAGCLKSTGTIVAVASGATPRRACVPPETNVVLSNGDITAVRGTAGGGIAVAGSTVLSGNVDKAGEVELALTEPFRLPQYCKGGQIPTRAASTSGWACADPLPPKQVTQVRALGPGPIGDDWSRLGGTIKLPAGAWSIVAKSQFTGDHSPGADDAQFMADCRLGVGTNPATDWGSQSSEYDGQVVLNAAVRLGEPFNVSMSCRDRGAHNGRWYGMTITATPVDEIRIVNW